MGCCTFRSFVVCLTLVAWPLLMADVRAQGQIPDCTAAPYNVPAGLPSASTTAAQDQAQMMCQQHLLFPTPASNPPLTATRVDDPNKPVNAWPGNLAEPETANWTDALGHTIVRWGWGLWTTYDDSQSGGAASVLCNGAATCTPQLQEGTSTGGAMSGFGDFGPRGSRPFLCLKCGFEENADYVSSVNVLSRGMKKLRDERQDTADASAGRATAAEIAWQVSRACGGQQQEPAEETVSE